jgi:LPS-assembly protein
MLHTPVLVFRMQPRTLVFITLLTLCHQEATAQRLTIGLPQANSAPPAAESAAEDAQPALPEAPSQDLLPIAAPEPEPAAGAPVVAEADRQTRVGDVVTLSGAVLIRYRDYAIRADRIVYDQSTTQLNADGHVEVTGGPYDAVIKADRGEMRLNAHTARFFNVTGSMGLRSMRRASVYSTTNPMLFSGRLLLQNGEGKYRVVDGSITNCRLPKPDWALLAGSVNVADEKASMTNARFKFLGAPIFYLPYLRHPVSESGRQSGFAIPIVSNSTTRGLVVGEQFYWAISRSADMMIGAEYYSKRGWAPNGDFRYKGPDLDFFNARWNALRDRGVEEPSTSDPGQMVLTDQGGVDIQASGRFDLGANTRLAGGVEYLSSYIYRLAFSDSYNQATNSEVQSSISLTHNRNGVVVSGELARYQTFAGTGANDELRILHLPDLRLDAIDRPLGGSLAMWGLDSSLNFMSRSEYDFHARNLGRFDLYPRLSLPLHGGGWSFTPEAAARFTAYSASQTTGDATLPQFSHDPLNRIDYELSINARAPVLTRDFSFAGGKRVLRHTIAPEFSYRFVNGIASQARNVILIDTTDIATNTNEAGYSLTQRFYWKPRAAQPCADQTAEPADCATTQRPWASWQVAQKFFFDPRFGDALSTIPGRRSVFDSTLDLTGADFLTTQRDLSPVVSRMRFEGIENLRLEWDLDYDTVAGRIGASNVYAGYSLGRTTFGVGHALLNAVDASSSTSLLKSQELQPFLYIGSQTSRGFNLAMNGGYEATAGVLQYAGAQALYNWNCCGLSVGYRRYSLGSLGGVGRDETQWLYSFTLANFGSVGDIRRSNQVFRDTTLPPAY